MKPGMTVSVKPASKEMKAIKIAKEDLHRELPEYLVLEEGHFSGKLEVAPQMDQIPLPLPINIPLVCEFLAHTN